MIKKKKNYKKVSPRCDSELKRKRETWRRESGKKIGRTRRSGRLYVHKLFCEFALVP